MHPSAGTGSITRLLPTPQNSLSYKFHRYIALVSFIVCLMVVFVGGTFTFIHDMNPVHGISAYSIPILSGVWTGVGFYLRKRKDKGATLFNDLSTEEKLRGWINTLDNVREMDLRPAVEEDAQWNNAWGILSYTRKKNMSG